LATSLRPDLAFLADWEKAYDLVDRPFLKSCLGQFGFGGVFINWFLVLHKATSTKVLVNGFMTTLPAFDVCSGVWQGWPWAPFLFLCAVEPLACALRNSDLSGITLRPDGHRIVYSGYADDTTLFLSGVEDLQKALLIFNEYSSVSGMKLNLFKCSVVPFKSLTSISPPAALPFK
jgi:hypothetical protein